MEKGREVYPLYIKVCGDIEKGKVLASKGGNTIIDSYGAITIEITVNSADYPKDKVYEAVKKIALKAAEYYYL